MGRRVAAMRDLAAGAPWRATECRLDPNSPASAATAGSSRSSAVESLANLLAARPEDPRADGRLGSTHVRLDELTEPDAGRRRPAGGAERLPRLVVDRDAGDSSARLMTASAADADVPVGGALQPTPFARFLRAIRV